MTVPPGWVPDRLLTGYESLTLPGWVPPPVGPAARALAAGGTDPAAVWTCWRDGGPACLDAGLPNFGVQEQIRLLRVQGSFNLVLAAGVDGGNDLRRWLEYRPADPDGRSVAAAWRVDDRSACATPTCWQSTLLPVAAQVPLVATDVSAGPAAP